LERVDEVDDLSTRGRDVRRGTVGYRTRSLVRFILGVAVRFGGVITGLSIPGRQKGRKLAKFRDGFFKIAQTWVDEKCVVCRDGLGLVLEYGKEVLLELALELMKDLVLV
jgi:hypothetical protein